MNPRPLRSTRLAAAVALSVAVLAPSEARAFCRTTTVPPDSGYDPAATGSCWSQGRAVAWPWGASVGYELDQSASTQVDLADFTTAANEAFTAWNTAACPFGDGAAPHVFGYESGTVDAALVSTDCGLIACGPTVHDPHHVITFRDSGWSSNDPVNTLALTIVTYGVSSGTIFDADIEINSSQHTISVADPPPASAYDLRSILTHEAGHFLGLAHSQDGSAVMYAYYRPGSIALTADDVDGICAAYGPPKEGGGSCALTSGPASGHAFGVGGIVAVAALFARRRRRAPTRDSLEPHPRETNSLPSRSLPMPQPRRSPRSRRAGSAFALALAGAAAAHLVTAPDARAYCRTTTVPVEAGYNPVATGTCMMDGKPIAWPQGDRVGYELDQSASVQVDLPSFITAAAGAFDAWNTVGCPFGDGGSAPPNISTFQGGIVDASLVAVDCGFVDCGSTVHDSHHVITFRDKEFVSTDPTSTIALTIVTYGVTSGTIFDADTEINSAQYSISVARPTPGGSYDLQSIITHEAGHFLGLAHSQVEGAAMDAFYPPGRPITLTADDDDGICAIYPPPATGAPGPSAVGGCAVASAPRSGGAFGIGALGLAVAGVLRRRRRCRV